MIFFNPFKGLLLGVTEMDHYDESQVFDIYWNRDFLVETQCEHIQSTTSTKKKGKEKVKTDIHQGVKVLNNYDQPTGTDFSYILRVSPSLYFTV